MVRSGSNEEVMKLFDVGAPNLWGHFKDRVLEECDEMCGKKRGGEVKDVHCGGMMR